MGLFFFFIWVSIVQAAPASAPASLGQVFCSESIYQVQQGLHLEQSTDSWDDFVGRMEKRQARAGVSARAVQDCIKENRADLEKGEFLLQGKQLLRQIANESKPSVGVHALEPILGSVVLPGFGEVPLHQTTHGIASSIDGAAHRGEHYNVLWRHFTEDLRKTMTERRHRLKIIKEDH